eukprot:Clim_evm61s109 gene=Clim_evmTU61s109
MAVDPKVDDKEKKDGEMEVDKPEEIPVDPEAEVVLGVRAQLNLIEKTAVSKELRFLVRSLRYFPKYATKLNPAILRGIVEYSTPAGSDIREYVKKQVGDGEAKAPNEKEKAGTAAISKVSQISPEVDIYIRILIIAYFLRVKEDVAKAMEIAEETTSRALSQNRRTLDPLTAKVFYQLFRTYELSNRLPELRPRLHRWLRTATLHQDVHSQAMLINLLLRDYTLSSLYGQAQKLIARANFPEKVPNNQWSRYLYYMGRTAAVQLDYTDAKAHLTQSIRKAPQHTAIGFHQTVQKLAIIVDLLLGEIPARSLFRQPKLKKALAPYLELTQAVRVGDLTAFAKCLETHGDKFKADKNYLLILRLRHNVIKMGIKNLNMSYSRIALSDVAKRLGLDDAQDARYIVAKAIRDGVVNAGLDHAEGTMKSNEFINVYSTSDPQVMFNERIKFCLNLHNESVKAMRYPPDAHRGDPKGLEERKMREQLEKELAEELSGNDEF